MDSDSCQSEKTMENTSECFSDFAKLNDVEEIADTFEAIEDKILERGLLVNITGGDSESDISISCELLEENGKNLPIVAIRIESEKCKSIEMQRAESLADFISEKIDDCSNDWPENTWTEDIEENVEMVVFLNELRVY